MGQWGQRTHPANTSTPAKLTPARITKINTRNLKKKKNHHQEIFTGNHQKSPGITKKESGQWGQRTEPANTSTTLNTRESTSGIFTNQNHQ